MIKFKENFVERVQLECEQVVGQYSRILSGYDETYLDFEYEVKQVFKHIEENKLKNEDLARLASHCIALYRENMIRLGAYN